MNIGVHRACVYSGFACVLVFLLGFWVVAGFIPPPDPDDNAAEIAELFRDDKNSIRAGMIISMFGAALIAPWVTAVSVQIRRIEGKHSPLAFLQLGLGMLLTLEFIYLIMFWQVAAFRTDRPDTEIQTLNDMAWIPFVGLSSTAVIQAIVIGVAILTDRSVKPVFPTWAGYLNLWVALVFTSGTFNVFFKDGPLAWDGVIAWYIPLATFCIWLVVMSYLMLTSEQPAREPIQTGASKTNGAGLTVESLAAELAEVRKEVAASRPDR